MQIPAGAHAKKGKVHTITLPKRSSPATTLQEKRQGRSWLGEGKNRAVQRMRRLPTVGAGPGSRTGPLTDLVSARGLRGRRSANGTHCAAPSGRPARLQLQQTRLWRRRVAFS